MTKNRVFILPLILIILLNMPALAQDDSLYLNVRLFANRDLTSIQIQSADGSFKVLNGDKEVTILNKNIGLSIKSDHKKVRISKMDAVIGIYDTLRFVPVSENSLIRIKSQKEDRKYDDELKIYIVDGKLQIINYVELGHYIASAVLSETGSKESPEFYKIQALISRTYAVRNMRKHELEKYHLCDQVHCQLYRGHCTNETVLAAVKETHGQVIVDSTGALISAAFHSNSGGQTMNSEDVWSLAAPYLRAVEDSFSISMPMARWEKRIPKEKWLNYLKEKHKYPLNDTKKRNEALNFTQEKRKSLLGDSIPLKVIRSDFKLRSTYFNIVQDGDMLVFKGKGFGHGVGLSQEGAINMVKKGYHYEDIIKFYYYKVNICPFDSTMIPRKK